MTFSQKSVVSPRKVSCWDGLLHGNHCADSHPVHTVPVFDNAPITGQPANEEDALHKFQRLNRPRILVIEDNMLDRMAIHHALCKGFQDFEILEAHTLADGHKILSGQRIDCLILDYMLPDGSGLSFLNTLNGDPLHRYLGTIFITGQGDEEIAASAFKLGALDYLSKGTIDPDRISAAVHRTLAHCRLRHEVDSQRHVVESFAAILAHDLRDPLSAAQGYLNLSLSKFQHNKLENSYLCEADKGIRYALGLIQELVHYTKNGNKDLKVSPVKLVDVLQYAKDVVLHGYGPDHNITIRISEDLPVVEGNFEAFALLFQNLLQNSVKYAAGNRPPIIEVACKMLPDHIRISVRDNGTGIAAKDLNRIFLPLVRGSDCGNVSGFGLGLASCQRVANLFSGHIECTSRQGAGSCFTVCLPHSEAIE